MHPAVSWKYYDYALTSWATMSNLSEPGGPASHDAFDYWNPQAAKQEWYSAPLLKHFVGQNMFFADARNGSLPDLSWRSRSSPESDHPDANTTAAESWIASVVDSLETSPDWNSTALFVTFDESRWILRSRAAARWLGDALVSIRLLVISPYVRAG